MKRPKVLPWTIRALLCVIVSLFILTDLVSGQGTQEIAPLPSSPSVPAATPEAVPQVACTYAISPASHSVSSAEETGSISVTTTTNCGWTASSGAPWITVGPQASGTGNGMITYSVGANQATAPRTGMITVAGQVFQLTQAAGSIPQYTLKMLRAGSGQGKVSSNPAGDVFKRGTSGGTPGRSRRQLGFRRLDGGVLGNVHNLQPSDDFRQDGDGDLHAQNLYDTRTRTLERRDSSCGHNEGAAWREKEVSGDSASGLPCFRRPGGQGFGRRGELIYVRQRPCRPRAGSGLREAVGW